MAKQGQKLTDELKEQIKAHLVISDNKNEIAKKLGVSWSTVDKIAKEIHEQPEEKEEFEKLRDDKKQEMIERIWDGLTDAATLGNRMIREALTGQRDIPLNHISTYYGTMYDKHALMTGGKTADVGVNGEVKQTHEYIIEQNIKSDPESAELLKQLYKRSSAFKAMGDTG